MKQEYKLKMLESEIRKVLSEALMEMKDPNIDPMKSLITISRVEVSKDKRYADVYVSVLGDEAKRKDVVNYFEQKKGYFRTYVAKNIRMYTAPELRFKEDKGIEATVRIGQLLDSIKESQKGDDNK
ncbi:MULTISPECIES: 30S ribosome-binding factor RbfA [Fervidobacterium]|uniref:Ribosome-binding factor A n=1 Tax=Fervidobacterium nodosum (strain ATCC 35602 / DSM 5306 / Rt17-B1) TaxID=381764 RepID=RBFA_FERNB|nr:MULTISPECIES: 30S ribosome-binding factor RbfA [Fervidobacterium]A7HK34.1 RecName: Full=Ribosome-binding factor A [Fervidobacterium nodosum Rt17-B1]PHJ14359.1 ribosome-binding factor A [Fervidobacterium sp. SC_NGM5_G05]HOJ93924.1 30S ribosome-binding factor RbfA [Fervidobacterium nodosum]ABS60267.1 ribosome-binding factor A [Fervidobacterium nodosum Rt17-B1]KAF2961453.1 ribosome-binding factor A [Fervidobacterium sp. 2310opik-2]